MKSYLLFINEPKCAIFTLMFRTTKKANLNLHIYSTNSYSLIQPDSIKFIFL